MNQRKVVYDGYFKVDVVDTPYGRREVIRALNSVAVLLYSVYHKKIILVRQRRASFIELADNPEGFVTEAVAGRMDDKLSARWLMAKEIKEETGIDIDPRDIEPLNCYHALATTPGMTDERIFLGLAEIPAGQRIPELGERFGNKEGGESTEIVVLPFENLRDYTCKDLKTLALIQALKLKLVEKERRHVR